VTQKTGTPETTGRAQADAENPFLSTREQAEGKTAVGQQRNRLWWETKPMTYADWEAKERLPRSAEELTEIENQIISQSPFMRDTLDWSQFNGLKVLDIGCGSGALATRIAKHGATVTAVDLTQTAVDLTRRNAALQNLDVDVIRCDVEKLPIESDKFDFVFSWGVLHHTETFENALKEVNRVLRPGGRSLIMVYYRNSIVYYLHGLYWLVFRGYMFRGYTINGVQDLYTDGYFHRYFSVREMRRCLEAAGLMPTRFSVTQYEKKILPGIPKWFDTFLKRKVGMCLVAEFEKPSKN
jgi:2-polyprenyl-3-methyl-5-hydroxy-6-metoxy-1,4-benzoquinol methylase